MPLARMPPKTGSKRSFYRSAVSPMLRGNERAMKQRDGFGPTRWGRGAVVSALLVATAGMLCTGQARAIDDADCLLCHGDPSAAQTADDGSIISLYVNETLFRSTAHGSLTCDSCHADITETPHPPKLKPVDCGACHVEVDEYAASLHGQALARGDADIHGCSDCHGSHDVRKSTDPLATTFPRNLASTCGKCHSDPGMARRHLLAVNRPSEAYLKSVHARAIAGGNLEAAVCNDCHGTHNIQPRQMPESPINRWNIANTCGQCHAKIREEFETSIHGRALKAGVEDAPTCTDCHGEHDIEGPGMESSSVSKQMVSRSTCPRCHDDERVMKRYGIETMRRSSYMDSYHGLASAAGSRVVADCSDCHGIHNILEPENPAASVNVANLPNTCGKCHENAGPNFAAGPVHIMPTAASQRVLGVVRIVYLWLIVLVIGGMVLHNTLLMLRHMLTKLFAEMRGRKTRRRFTTAQTVGHFILSVSFTGLALSGFALRYPESWWSRFLFFGDTGLEIRAVVHRITGVVFIALMLVNLFYLLFLRSGRAELATLVLRRKDAADVLRNMAYALGFTNKKPLFDRYSYSEKFEYWGLWWGALLMIITGLCMWQAGVFLDYLPKYLLDIAALIHFYEAILAVATIIVWHIYHMVFDPDAYPMNWSWVTGRITETDFKERHTLEYLRELEAQGGNTPASPEPGLAASPPAHATEVPGDLPGDATSDSGPTKLKPPPE